MEIQFEKLKGNPNQFFDILPNDWKISIVPNWIFYKKTATIYVIKENNEIICGGIVFTEKLKEMTPFEISHAYLFADGFNYLGYIWVAEHKRNLQLATTWLSYLKALNPNQKYWLTIEEEQLNYFYKKNGFKLFSESHNDFDNTIKEWIFTYTPNIS
ncbi:hypothetical protein [Lutibacter sp.]|uniref:hypothetical protein n=1 Tax=Lutibacter sp. TaxID=1925666 RepID=UPI001A21AB99|nr:hypothetical protein [Lutibacter sp.]MBI9040010.1 hypothetical protein [Lutibacter sp.]